MVYREEWSDAGYPVSPKKPTQNLNQKILSTNGWKNPFGLSPLLHGRYEVTVHTISLEARMILVGGSYSARRWGCLG